MLEVTLRWASIPSRREQQYSLSLNATETKISSGLPLRLVCRLYLPTSLVIDIESAIDMSVFSADNLTIVEEEICLRGKFRT